ncbi:glycosyl transferase [Bacteroidota bacterium]|nr:glycosyl transferase [Bacteroidota bacterium]
MKKKTPFLLKQVERAAYLFLSCALATGRLLALFFTTFPFLLKRKNPTKDFLFFPYAHKDNIGTISRFQIFLPLLEKDKFTFDIHYTWSAIEDEEIFFKSKSRTKEYLFLARSFWRRLFQSMRAGNYRAVFFQRGLFPEYYDQFTPYLENLICKLNQNVTVDFFDADYGRNKKLVDATARVCNKVAVVNQHLFQYFNKLNPNVCYNDLAVDVNAYKIKSDYNIKTPIAIFWTGSEANALNLKEIIPVLERINLKYPLQLRMISRTTCGYASSIINHAQWKKETFFNEMINADIAIYPAMKDTEFTRGKVAYKSIEYGAAALPIVASPFGLSPHLEIDADVLFANNIEEWEKQILRLISNESLRKKIGVNARMKAEKYHSVNSTYKNFLEILLGENPTPLNS